MHGDEQKWIEKLQLVTKNPNNLHKSELITLAHLLKPLFIKQGELVLSSEVLSINSMPSRMFSI